MLCTWNMGYQHRQMLCNGAACSLWLWQPGRLGYDKEGLRRQDLHGTVVSAVPEA